MRSVNNDDEDIYLLYCIVFIHFYSASHSLSLSEALPRQQSLLCRSSHAEALQAIAGKGLAQGPYMAARAGFEPTTLRSNDVASTNAPPCPTVDACVMHACMFVCMYVTMHVCSMYVYIHVYI